ncbi:MAG TPA: M6 family metalloprotease domain-containing protein [Vicinamibacterales bacterium]|nr:M6 family metalloprotease domain-containing protein [Vicinamibacterales bacterium]
MAVRFDGQVFTFTQPDGTTIQLRGWGDQYYAVFETLEGYTVTKNPATGYWEVARLAPDGNALEPAPTAGARLEGARAGVPKGLRVRRESAMAAARESALRASGRRCEQRRRERREQQRAIRAMAAAGGPMLAPPQRQTVGTFVGLCLLIDFSDAPATISREEVDRFCNQTGYNGFGNHGSVSDFFLENSLGRCRYTNIVVPYYRALHPKTYYTDRTIPQPRRAYELMNEAIAFHKAQGFDFSPLTVDSQGFVYAMNVYYAGPVTNNWAEGLWPHSHHLGTAVQLRSGMKAYDYQFTAMGSELGLGTFCHENGHMLCDYPDLYDYGYESSGVGGYCLMCAGNNVSERNPIPISAYLKRLSGWAGNVTTITHGATITLEAGTNDFAIYSRGGREYFLIENRRRTGRDASLPDEGLAIWHVDEEGDNSHEQMTSGSHYELSLEQADGLFQLERQRNQIGDAGDLFAGPLARFGDSTLPDSKWWNGTSSNLRIEEVSAADQSITFKCFLSDVTTPPATLTRTSTPNRAIPENNQAGITDTIDIAEALTISSLRVGVDITHTYRGDLNATLTTPWGTVIELHPKGRGGNAHDLKVTYDAATLPALATLRGRSSQGTWRLMVRDLAPGDTGKLNQWSLEFSAAAVAVAPIELKESPGLKIPDAPSGGIVRTLAATSAATIGSVEVSVDISHTWIGDLRVSVRSPSGTEAILHDGAGGAADNIVKTFTAANAPPLAALAGQPAGGTWQLNVVDRSAQDEGKLNEWKVSIKPSA